MGEIGKCKVYLISNGQWNIKRGMAEKFLNSLKLYFFSISTDVNEIQDEEGVKRVAPPLTAHTCHAIVSYGVAAHS